MIKRKNVPSNSSPARGQPAISCLHALPLRGWNAASYGVDEPGSSGIANAGRLFLPGTFGSEHDDFRSRRERGLDEAPPELYPPP
jgi:hypothetical protein